MKKLLLATIPLVALAGCSGGVTLIPSFVDSGSGHYMAIDKTARIFTDPETHCQYLIYTAASKGGITARLDKQGKPMCGRAA